LVNATGSAAGIEFAAKYSDLIFITSPGGAHIDSALETLPAHIATIKEAAKAVGRKVKTLINPIIISRDTPEEAEVYADSIAECSGGSLGSSKFNNNANAYKSDAHGWRGRKDPNHKQGRNLGGNIEIIGSPEQVIAQIKALHKTGVDGIQMNFYDFAPDLDYFGRKILPLLKTAGLRI
jgi:FMNH2-dependent dimethyl sulfone monooxygenase